MRIVSKKMGLKESKEELLVVALMQGEKLPAELEQQSKLVKKEVFEGKSGQTFGFTEGSRRILLYGLGEEEELILDQYRRLAGTGIRSAKGAKVSLIAIYVEPKKFKKEEVAQAIAEALILANYKPLFFKSKVEDEFEIKEVLIGLDGTENAVNRGVILASAQNYVREINEHPANMVTPQRMSEFAKEIGKKNNLTVTIMEKEELKKKGMNGILGVAQGSVNPPVLVTIEYNKERKELPLLAVVGKGVCFDSGGISIKPSKGMQEMKYDKTGACITLGIMQAVAGLKLPIRLIGVFPAVENMPSGTAQRPGDIVKMYNGKTAEVLNTDAEGRLILGDALAYTCEKKPEAVIDLATLTGAIVVCLGNHAIGLFSNDDELAEMIEKSGVQTHERVWRMPIWKEYAEMIKGDFADIKNIGSESGEAGSITAAMFLKEFVGDTKWAHLDIAGVDNIANSHPYLEKGAAGIGLRLVVKTLENFAKK